jgi:hypothetical protein
MKLRNVRLEESLDVRNKVYEMINDAGFKFSEWFNDLYKVKNGEVRRLKGIFYNKVEEGVEVIDEDKYDMVLEDMKLMLNNLEFKGDYVVSVDKIGKYMDEECRKLYKVEVCIIKIKWCN